MNESKLLETVNEELGLELKSTKSDRFCPYDAYDDVYTVELKCRRTHYNTQMIEEQKIKNLHPGKELLYVVSTPAGIYSFNVSELLKSGYDFSWETRRLPATTDFKRKQWVDKVVGYINVSEAFWRNEYDSAN